MRSWKNSARKSYDRVLKLEREFVEQRAREDAAMQAVADRLAVNEETGEIEGAPTPSRINWTARVDGGGTLRLLKNRANTDLTISPIPQGDRFSWEEKRIKEIEDEQLDEELTKWADAEHLRRIERSWIPTTARPTKARVFMPEGEEVCPEWDKKGGWLYWKKGTMTFSAPAGCGKNYCPVCGSRRLRQRRVGLYAWLETMGTEEQERYHLGTLTFRGRWTTATKVPGIRFCPSWEQWCKQQRVDIDDVPSIPEEWEDWEPRTFSRFVAMIMKAMSADEGVAYRGQMTARQWMKYMTGCWNRLADEWLDWTGRPMSFVRTWELQQNGTPHIHMAYYLPEGITIRQAKKWTAEHWTEIVGDIDTDTLEHGVHMGKHVAGIKAVAHSAFEYVIKYITKDNTAVYRGKKTSRGETIDWNTRLRRVAKSHDCKPAITGDIEAFRELLSGEVFNKHEYRRSYGKMSNAVMGKRPISDRAAQNLLQWLQEHNHRRRGTRLRSSFMRRTGDFANVERDDLTPDRPPGFWDLVAQTADGSIIKLVNGTTVGYGDHMTALELQHRENAMKADEEFDEPVATFLLD